MVTKLLILGSLLSLWGCQSRLPECLDRLGCVTIRPQEPIELGVLQSLSGTTGFIGQTQLESIQLAIAQRQSQLLGHPIVVHIEDELCSPEGGANGALKLTANPQILAVWGTTCSGAAAPASQILSEAGRVMVSGTNTAPSLTAITSKKGEDWYPGYFRTSYNGAGATQAAAEFTFRELNLKTAATLNDGDNFTQGLTQAFEEAFVQLGGTVVLRTTVNKGDQNMKPVLQSVALSEAELLYFPLLPAEGIQVIKQVKQIPELSKLTLMTGALQSEAVLSAIGQDGVGVYFTSFLFPDTESMNQLHEAYMAQYGKAPDHPFYGFAYDAANMVLEAIATVAVSSPDGTLQIGRQALREALYQTSNFEGVTGSLSCDPFGDCARNQFSIVQFQDPRTGLQGLENNRVSDSLPHE